MSAPDFSAKSTQNGRRKHHLVRVLCRLRFFGSFGFGAVATVRILHFEAIDITPAQIGLLMAGYSVVAGLIEIPSGAIADVRGRRRAKLMASALLVASYVVIALASNVIYAAIGLGVLAVGRALSSGAVESWFVDEVGEADDPIVLSGLASAEAAHNAGTALGAIFGGLLPWFLADLTTSVSVFAPVFAISAVALAIEAVITINGMVETVPPAGLGAVSVWRTTAAGIAGTMGTRVPRWVAAIMVTIGALNACVELLTPLGLSEGIGADRAAIWFGVLVAGAWLLSAYAATKTTAVERWAGSLARAAGLGTAALVLVTLPAALKGWFFPSVGYVGLNVATGPLMPLLGAIVHRHVRSEHRSTSISTLQLSILLGATIGSIAVAVIDGLAVVLVAVAMLSCAYGLLRAQRGGALVSDDG